MSRTEFNFHLAPELPPLAWLAVVRDQSPAIAVFHGKYVEVSNNFFMEGVWAGDFSRGDPANSDCVFGSGGEIGEAGVTFVSSTATTDYLYSYAASKETYVSNSLPLILGHANDRLDAKFTGYSAINDFVTKGIVAYKSSIPTRNGAVKKLMHRNLAFENGTPKIVDKPLPPPFDSFATYREYLRTRVASFMANARHPSRANRLGIYSTQSKGYDSTMVNAIAREFGVDAAFTVQQGKAHGRSAANDINLQVDDDGGEICRVLGIPAIVLNRHEFEAGIANELFYWAGMHSSSDLNLCGMVNHIKSPALLLTGNFGEVWYPTAMSRPETINDELVRWDLGGHGLSEIRLQTGYIQAAVPFLGGRRRQDILTITESPEMAPWRLGVRYDRPIPRRIAEEAGISRNMFGQKKMASVVEFSRPNIPFNEGIKRQYYDFLAANGLIGKWKTRLFPMVHSYNEFVSYSGRSQNIYAYYADRLSRRMTGRGTERLWQFLDGSIYCFAVNALADRF